MNVRTIHGVAIGLVGIAATAPAFAVPVNAALRVQYDHHFAIDLDTSTADGTEWYGADATKDVSFDPTRTYRLEQSQKSADGDAWILVGGSYESQFTTTDNSLSWVGSNTVEASARVDAGLTHGYAYATGATMNFDFLLQVLEPVVFFGTTSLYGANSSSGLTLNNGAILDPGLYWMSNPTLHAAIAVDAYAAESEYATKTVSAAYSFTAVPAPPTMALAVMGLLAMLVTRTRKLL